MARILPQPLTQLRAAHRPSRLPPRALRLAPRASRLDLFYSRRMCRNIKPLFNFDPPVTDEEVRAASLQFVRKISGFTKPSKTNEAAFDQAIEEVAAAARRLMDSLVTTAPARDREIEAAKAKARGVERFAR
jgi:hypothetical protein